jgi:capsid protein
MGEDQDVYDAQTVDIQPGTITTLAPGYDIGQIKPEHPANTHKDFMRSILAECGRPAGMPYNVVALDSSNHNYSSGRLDWQAFHRYLKTEREVIERQVLQQIIESFVGFARLSEIDLTEQEAAEAANDWTILWPGLEHVDPTKEANAAIDLVGSNLKTYQDYFAEQGADYRDEFAQISEEKKLMDSLGITRTEVKNAISETVQTDDEEAEDADEKATA